MQRYGRFLKILKIADGKICVAMAAAQALGLRYSSSAGVITCSASRIRSGKPYGSRPGGC